MSGSNRDGRAKAISCLQRLKIDTPKFLVAFCIVFTAWVAPYYISTVLVSVVYEERTASPEYYIAKCEQNEAAWDAFNRAQRSKDAERKSKSEKNNPATKTNKTAYCDLAAQYIAARGAQASGDWTQIAAVIAFLGLVALVATLIYTKKAVDLTRENGVLERRPWIKFEKIALNSAPQFEWNGAGRHGTSKLNVTLSGRNAGASPAVDMLLHFKFIPEPFDEKNIVDGILASRTADFDAESQSFQSAKFPSNEAEQFLSGKLENIVTEDILAGGSGFVIASTYRSPESEKYFCTAEFYWIFRLDEGSRSFRKNFKDSVTFKDEWGFARCGKTPYVV